MGKIHSVFKDPENDNVKIWRYCDITKFLSLLDKRALFFSRIDKLEDRFEGSFPKATTEARPEKYRKQYSENADVILQFHSFAFEQIRKFFLVNCWSASEYEIAAMWKLHINNDVGIAIQSTYDRFKSSFVEDLEDDIHVGNVRYIDFNLDNINETNLFDRFFYKRKSFAFEREFRAVIFRVQESLKGGTIDIKRPVYEHGKYIKVNIDTLIEGVFVSPSAPEWFVSLVQSILEKYQINKKVKQSNLDDGPVY